MRHLQSIVLIQILVCSSLRSDVHKCIPSCSLLYGSRYCSNVVAPAVQIDPQKSVCIPLGTLASAAVGSLAGGDGAWRPNLPTAADGVRRVYV